MTLVFRMLGKLEVVRDGQVWVPSLQEKTLAMVAYMAYMQRPQSRQSLAELFCSEANDRAASLRWHLSRIRKVFGKESVFSEGSSLSMVHEREHSDVVLFESVLSRDVEKLPPDTLKEALSHYRGPLLHGLQLKNAPHFDIWLTGERSRLGMMFENGMQAYIQHLLSHNLHNEVIECAQKMVELDPLREETHSLLMWLYARSGQRDAAIQQFQLCKSLRKEHLDLPVLEETEMLYQQILEGDFGPTYEDFLVHAGPAEEFSLPPAEESQEEAFVGRKEALGSLQQVWSTTTRGQGQCVLLEAEAGGGKTRLTQVMLSTLGKAKVLEGRCYSSEQALPFHPWISVFEGLLSQLTEEQKEALPPFVAEQVGRLSPQLALQLHSDISEPSADEPHDLNRFYAALKLLVSTLAESAPVLVWLDDLHWADEASFRLLHHLVRALEQSRVMWLASYRPEELQEHPVLTALWQELQRAPQCKRLPLSRLTREELGRLVSLSEFGALETDKQDALRDALLTHTGGNPLYAVELLKSFGGTFPEQLQFEVSPSIQTLLTRRLQLWRQVHRQILETIAVFGRPVNLLEVSIAGACSEEEAAEAIERGVAWKVLEEVQPSGASQASPNPVYRIIQAIVQQALVSQLSSVRRQLLHKRVGLALERTGGAPALLAHHWRLAGVPDKECEAAERAAIEAKDCYAYDEAASYLARSVELLQDPKKRLSLQRMRGEVLQTAGRWDEAEQAFQDAFAAARQYKEPEQIAASALSLGRFTYARGDLKRALQWCARARDLFQQRNADADTAMAWGDLGKVHRRMGELDKAIECYQKKADIAQAIGDNRLHCEALGAMSGIAIQQGDTEQAVRNFQQTLQIAVEEEALFTQAEDGPLSSQDEGHVTISRMMGHAGFLANDQDQYMEAISYFEEQLDFFDDLGETERVKRGLKQLGAWYVWIGDFARALTFVQRLFDLATQRFSFPGLSKAAGNMGEIYFAAGALDWARACYEYKLSIGLDLKEKRGIVTSLCRLAQLLVSLERDELAADTKEVALALGQKYGFWFDLLSLHEALGQIYTERGLDKEAAAHQQEAEQLFATLEARGKQMQPPKTSVFESSTELQVLPAPPNQITQFHITLDRQLTKVKNQLL